MATVNCANIYLLYSAWKAVFINLNLAYNEKELEYIETLIYIEVMLQNLLILHFLQLLFCDPISKFMLRE